MIDLRKRYSTLCFYIAAAAIIISINCSPGWAQGVPNVLAQNPEIQLSAKLNESECKPLVADNETSAPIVISSLEKTAWSEYLRLTDPVDLPLTLAPGESVRLAYACFTPKIVNKEYDGIISIRTSSASESTKIHLHAVSIPEPRVNIVPATAPGAVLAFDPATIKEGTLISMVGRDAEFIRSFNFKNVSQHSITVTNLDFQDHDQRFDVVSIGPGGSLPLDVAPGASFSVKISYHSFSRIPSTNHLLIFTEQSKEPVKYEIRGLQLPLSSMEWNKHEGQSSK